METINIEQIRQYLPLIIPFAIIQLGLMIAALIHILTHKNYKTGNRTFWVIICIVVNTIGPILYFVIGRSDKEEE
jgi:glucose uptake protein GlcU